MLEFKVHVSSYIIAMIISYCTNWVEMQDFRGYRWYGGFNRGTKIFLLLELAAWVYYWGFNI